jgi:hypothetical protein
MMIAHLLRSHRLEREYQALCEVTRLSDDPRLSEAASLLVLAQTDVSLDEASIQKMTGNLVDLAYEYAVSPETIQRALHQNEPMLLGDAYYGDKT